MKISQICLILIFLPLNIFAQDYETRSIDTLNSDYGHGLINNLPYFKINEYSGHTALQLNDAGAGFFQMLPAYKMPNRFIVNETPLSRKTTGIMGKNWHAGAGFLWVKTFYDGTPSTSHWEEVIEVDGAGNQTVFTRDLLFVDVPNGADPTNNGFGPDAKDTVATGLEPPTGKWFPTRKDVYFIDPQFRRMVREMDTVGGQTVYGYYWMLNPDGSKVKYAPTPFYDDTYQDPVLMGAYQKWVPIEFISPSGRKTTLTYKDMGRTLTGLEVPSWFPEKIYDHGQQRYLKCSYEPKTLTGPLGGMINQPADAQLYLTKVELFDGGDVFQKVLSTFDYQTQNLGDIQLTAQHLPHDSGGNYTTQVSYDTFSVGGNMVNLAHEVTTPQGGKVRIQFQEVLYQDLSFIGPQCREYSAGALSSGMGGPDPEGGPCDNFNIEFYRNQLRIDDLEILDETGQAITHLQFFYDVLENFPGYEGGSEPVDYGHEDFLQVRVVELLSGAGLSGIPQGEYRKEIKTIYGFPLQPEPPHAPTSKAGARTIGRPLIRSQVFYRPVLATQDPTDVERSEYREEWVYEDPFPFTSTAGSKIASRIGGTAFQGFTQIPLFIKRHRVKGPESYKQNLNLWSVTENTFDWPIDWRSQQPFQFNFANPVESKNYTQLISGSGQLSQSAARSRHFDYAYRFGLNNAMIPDDPSQTDPAQDIFVLTLKTYADDGIYATPDQTSLNQALLPLGKVEQTYHPDFPLLTQKTVFYNPTDSLKYKYQYYVPENPQTIPSYDAHLQGLLAKKAMVYGFGDSLDTSRQRIFYQDYQFGIPTEVNLPPSSIDMDLATDDLTPDIVTVLNPDGTIEHQSQDGITTNYTYDLSGRVLTEQSQNDEIKYYEYPSPGQLSNGQFFERAYQGSNAFWSESQLDAWNRVVGTKLKVTSALDTDAAHLEYDAFGRAVATTNAMGAVTTTSVDVLGRVIESKTVSANGDQLTYFAVDHQLDVDFSRTDNIRDVIRVQTTQTYGATMTDAVVKVSKSDLMNRTIYQATNPSPNQTNQITFSYDYLPNEGLTVTTIKPYDTQNTEHQRKFANDWLGRSHWQDHPEYQTESGHDLTVTYDALGRTMQNQSPLLGFSREYDDRHRQVTLKDLQTGDVLLKNVYDPLKNVLTQEQFFAGASYRYSNFDAMNRPQTITLDIPKPIEGPQALFPVDTTPHDPSASFHWEAPSPTSANPLLRGDVADYHVRLFNEDDELVWEQNHIEETFVAMPWEWISPNQTYRWEVRAYFTSHEPTVWTKTEFTVVANKNGEVIHAFRSGGTVIDGIRFYGRNDTAILDIYSNVPNATVYVWRYKDGQAVLEGEPLPHAQNQTDANGNLHIEFPIWPTDTPTQSLEAFCGTYSHEYFKVGSPSNQVQSNTLQPFIIDCAQATAAGDLRVKPIDPQIDYQKVVSGEQKVEKIRLENLNYNDRFGSLISFSDLEIRLEQYDSKQDRWLTDPSAVTNFGILGFYHEDGTPYDLESGGIYFGQGKDCLLDVAFTPDADLTVLTSYEGRIVFDYQPADVTKHITITKTLLGQGAPDIKPEMILGLNMGPGSWDHNPRTRTVVKEFDFGRYIPGDFREFQVWNPCLDGCGDLQFRGQLDVWQDTDFYIHQGTPGNDVDNVTLQPRPETHAGYAWLQSDQSYPFMLNYQGSARGFVDIYAAQLNMYLMQIDPGGHYNDFSNDTFLSPSKGYNIKANIVDDPYFVISQGGDPIQFPPVPIGEWSEATFKIKKNIRWPALPYAFGQGDFASIQDEPVVDGNGDAVVLNSWTVPQQRQLAYRLTQEGTVQGTIEFRETGGWFGDGRFGTITYPAQAFGTPRIKLNPNTVDFGDIPIGEEAYIAINLKNTSWSQVMAGRMYVGPNSGFGFLEELPAEGAAPVIGPEYTFEDLAFEEPPYANPQSERTFYVRFSPSLSRDYRSEITLSFCNNNRDLCDKFQNENVTLILQGRGIDMAQPDYRAVLQPESAQFQITYNTLGQMTQLKSPHFGNQEFQYNKKGDISKVFYTTDAKRPVWFHTGYAFQNSLGNDRITGAPAMIHYQQSYSLPRDVVTQLDDLGRLRSRQLQDYNANQAVIHGTQNVQYNPWGYLASFDRTHSNQTHAFAFEYTELGQLDTYRVNQSNYIHYDYDDFGNMTQRSAQMNTAATGLTFPEETQTTPFDDHNQVSHWFYDEEGRITNDGMQYFYDRMGKLCLILSEDEQLIAHYMYDPSGLRVRELRDDRVIYTYREGGTLLEQKTYFFDSGREEIQGFLGGKEGAVMAMEAIRESEGDPLVETDHRYYFYDHLGSPVVQWSLSDETIQEFSPYGQEMIQPNGNDQVIGFTGHEKDGQTGHLYMKARYQLPTHGRFRSPDPAKDFDLYNPASLNLYQYTYNNPINTVDPLGLAGEEDKKKDPQVDITVEVIEKITKERIEKSEKEKKISDELKKRRYFDFAANFVDNVQVLVGRDLKENRSLKEGKSPVGKLGIKGLEIPIDFAKVDNRVPYEGNWVLIYKFQWDEYFIFGDSTKQFVIYEQSQRNLGIKTLKYLGSKNDFSNVLLKIHGRQLERNAKNEAFANTLDAIMIKVGSAISKFGRVYNRPLVPITNRRLMTPIWP